MKILVITSNVNEKSGWARYSSDLIEAFKAQGEDVTVVQTPGIPSPLSWRRNYFLFPLYSLKLLLSRRTKGVELIHAHVETYAPLAMFLSLLLNVPYCVTLHGSYAVKPFSKNFFIKSIQRQAYKRASALFAVSNYTKDRILLYLPDLAVTVIPNGVKIGEQVVSNPENIILTVGPLKERKGIHTLSQALPKIFDKTDAKWILVGKSDGGKYATHIWASLEAYKDRYAYLEMVSDAELSSLYKRAKIFVLTPSSSEFDFEGFGLVYLEANAQGVPVIGSRDSGAEEAISDGENGFLIAPGNADELADRVIRLFEDKELYKEMRAKARRWAEDHSIERIAKQYIDQYEAVNH